MFADFTPDFEFESVYDVDFDKFLTHGKKGIIFDIDNTLVAHDAPCNEKSDALLRQLIQMGYKLFILSNNKEERVKIFIPNVYVDYIAKADKPSGKNYEKALSAMGLKKEEVIAVGDQLLTDCMGAKKMGITFVKVGIISKKEPIHIKFKRFLEKIIEIFTKGNKR